MGDTHMEEHAAWWIGHVVSLGAIGVTMIGWLPAIVALVPLVYYVLMIIDHPRVQAWIKSRRERKLALLRARMILLEQRIKSTPPSSPSDA